MRWEFRKTKSDSEQPRKLMNRAGRRLDYMKLCFCFSEAWKPKWTLLALVPTVTYTNVLCEGDISSGSCHTPSGL